MLVGGFVLLAGLGAAYISVQRSTENRSDASGSLIRMAPTDNASCGVPSICLPDNECAFANGMAGASCGIGRSCCILDPQI